MKSSIKYLALFALLSGGCAGTSGGVNTAPMVNAMSDCGTALVLQTDLQELKGVVSKDNSQLIRIAPKDVPQTLRGYLKYQGCWYEEKTDQTNVNPKKVWAAGKSTVEVYALELVKEPVSSPAAAGPAEQGNLYKLVALPYNLWKRGN